ncbi:MAG: hypothetical protein V3V30_07150 [Parvularculaceae bacterium]
MLSSLAILLLRIIAVIYFAKALATLPLLTYTDLRHNILPTLLSEAVYLGIAMGLWFGAPRLAKTVIAGREIEPKFSLMPDDLMRIGLVLLGLYLIANSLFAVAYLLPGLLHVIRKNAGAPVEGYVGVFNFYDVGQAMPALMGVALLVYAWKKYSSQRSP